MTGRKRYDNRIGKLFVLNLVNAQIYEIRKEEEMSEEKGHEALSWRRLPVETKYRICLEGQSHEIGALQMLFFEVLGAEKGLEVLEKFYASWAHQAYEHAKARGTLKGNGAKDVAEYLCTFYDTINMLPMEVPEATNDRVRIQLYKNSPELCRWGIPKGDDRLCYCGAAWEKELTKLVNPKLRAYLTKTKRWGDDYCEIVIEREKD